MLRITPWLVGLCIVSCPAVVNAQQGLRIDPRIAGVIAHGAPPPLFRPATPIVPGRAHVMIELRDGAGLAALPQRGVELVRVAGRPLVYRRFVPASIDAEGLAALTRCTAVARVELAPSAGRPPLDRSAQLISLEAARGAGPLPLTGQGVVIADLDTDIDVFHPAFFRADAGWFDWIDLNGDGRFSPGSDAIDLDGDGLAGRTEIARLLPAAPVDIFYGNDTSALRHGSFDPGLDWIYLDVDSNGHRDTGIAAGFDETTPAYGEPLFVPDDVDGNGVIDPEERFARLGTSKVRAVYLNIDRPPFSGVATRGDDLIYLREDYTGGVFGYADTLHGTGVDGILIADVPLVHRRWVGIAPDAELLVSFDLSRLGDGLVWALGQSPDIVLHEYVDWTRYALDGSDMTSRMIDDSTMSAGITHVCPSGNIGGAEKHAEVSLAPGGTLDLPLDVPTGTAEVEVTVHSPPGTTPTVRLVDPSGASYSAGMEALSGGGTVYTTHVVTSRGWDMTTFVAYNYSPSDPSLAVPPGRWNAHLVGDPTHTAVVEAFVSDNVSGFNIGAAWLAHTTDVSTMAWPSTADACIAVGAIPSHLTTDGPWYYGMEREGILRYFSGRGPRIDRARTIDVSAPDNPWSTLGVGTTYTGRPDAPTGAYQVFGGTSGAGPHVAGVAALLVEQGMRAPAVRDAIDRGAVSNGSTGVVPNDDHGHGHLSAAGALGVSPDGTAPHVELHAIPPVARPGDSISLVPTVTDRDGTTDPTLQWDVGYDGTWDAAPGPVAPQTLTLDHEGVVRVKVRARDSTGRVDEAAVLVTFSASAPVAPPDAGPPTTDAGSPGASGGGCCTIAGTRDPVGRRLFVLALALPLLVRAVRRARRRPDRCASRT